MKHSAPTLSAAFTALLEIESSLALMEMPPDCCLRAQRSTAQHASHAQRGQHSTWRSSQPHHRPRTLHEHSRLCPAQTNAGCCAALLRRPKLSAASALPGHSFQLSHKQRATEHTQKNTNSTNLAGRLSVEMSETPESCRRSGSGDLHPAKWAYK